MPAKNTKYLQALRMGAVAIVVLLLLTLIFSNIIISTYLQRVLKNQSTKAFKIEVKDLSVNIFTGKVNAENVSLMISNRKMELSIKFDNVYVNDFSIREYLKDKTYHSAELILNKGNISYYDKHDTIQEGQQKPLPEIIFDKLIGNDLKIKYDDGKARVITCEDLDFLVREIRIRELSTNISNEISYLNLREAKMLLKDSSYIFSAQHVSLLPAKKLLLVDSINVNPGKNEAEFFKRKKKQTDRFDVKVEKLVCNFEQIFNANGKPDIVVNYIFIQKPVADISRDRNYYREPTEKPIVQQLIRYFKFPMNVKRIFATKGRIEYREIQVNDPKPIDVWFSNFSSEWKNLNTSDTSGNFEILAKAKLYDEGATDLQLNFPLKTGSQYFIAVAQLKDIRLKRFNNAFAGKVNLKIKQGDIQSMQCRFIGGFDSSKGEMKLEYTNLKVETKDKKTKKSDSLKEKVKTFIANNILLNKQNNPETYSYVPLGAKRDKTRFVFNYIIKTLASGAVETVRKSKDQGVQKK